jgi:hypothetical protein
MIAAASAVLVNKYLRIVFPSICWWIRAGVKPGLSRSGGSIPLSHIEKLVENREEKSKKLSKRATQRRLFPPLFMAIALAPIMDLSVNVSGCHPLDIRFPHPGFAHNSCIERLLWFTYQAARRRYL